MQDAPTMILADKKGAAYEFAETIYEKLNSNNKRRHRYKLGHVDVEKFSDGEIYAEIKDSVRGRDCFFIQDSKMTPQDWLVSIGIVNDALMRSGAKTINDVLPYHKYMRQDRRAAPRSPITAKVAADMIQTYGNSVITTDVHNAATESAYRIPFENLKAFSYIINQIKERHPDFLENTILMAPDANSAKNTEIYARKLGVGMAIAHKVRDKSGIDSMTLIGNVKDKNVLIVDDMIDTGGTMRTAAEKIKEGGGRNIYACATHGLFSGDARKAFEASELEKIIVTNSIPQKSAGKIEVVPLEGLFSEVIYRMSHGESISEMYQK